MSAQTFSFRIWGGGSPMTIMGPGYPWGSPLPCRAGMQYRHSRDISLTVCEGAPAILREKLMLMHVIHHHYLGRNAC